MIRAKWIKSLAVALVCVGGAWGQQSSAIPTYNKGDTITLKEPGKSEVKVKVLKATRTGDGKISYEVQDMETGDKATISESPVSTPVTEAMPEKKKLFGLFSRSTKAAKQNDASPKMMRSTKAAKDKAGEPTMMPVGGIKESSQGAIKPASGTMPKHKMVPKEGSSSKALPSNWQESWGKANDHRTHANMPYDMELVSYSPEMCAEEVCDATMTIPNCKVPGSPYWHVPQMTTSKAGVSRVSR